MIIILISRVEGKECGDIMWTTFFIILGCLHTSLSQWSCTNDAQCADVAGSVCSAGACVCAPGTQIASDGLHCVNLAPYHTSTCVEDHQCSRLFVAFQCRRENEDDAEGQCACQPGFHYFHGRCWRTAAHDTACTHNEECMDTPVDPYSLTCDGVCVCAEGYYERQRGECRKIGYAVGDGCVLNEDCQFNNGQCDLDTLTCIDSNAARTDKTVNSPVTVRTVTSANVTVSVRTHGAACGVTTPCAEGFECSTFGSCICPVGYYEQNGVCFAELGSASTPEQCIGLVAEVIDGVCLCPPNFFYEENMRDCVRVTRRITDSCVTDSNCHTFGSASYCGPPVDPWQMRSCACDLERSVWNAAREMCQLFAGIGEECVVDSDCLAGELEIQCVTGVCTCPPGLVPSEGLCLTTGLAIGESCQASVECTATANTVCSEGLCSCDSNGYQEIDGFCAPIIGGSCTEDVECVIADTVCVNTTNTCQCDSGLVAYDDVCYIVSSGYERECNVTIQCIESLGENSACVNNQCVCNDGYHHRDGRCWPVTDLFESCSRTSECFLSSSSERVVCRNSMCQCDFHYPYDEELRTCVDSSAANLFGSVSVIFIALIYLFLS